MYEVNIPVPWMLWEIYCKFESWECKEQTHLLRTTFFIPGNEAGRFCGGYVAHYCCLVLPDHNGVPVALTWNLRSFCLFFAGGKKHQKLLRGYSFGRKSPGFQDHTWRFTRWWQLKDFLCSPRKLGKMNPFCRAYFSNGFKPPASLGWDLES